MQEPSENINCVHARESYKIIKKPYLLNRVDRCCPRRMKAIYVYKSFFYLTGPLVINEHQRIEFVVLLSFHVFWYSTIEIIKSLSTVQTTKQCSAVIGSCEEPLDVWLTVAKNALICRLSSEFYSPLLKGAVMCPNYQDFNKVQIDWQSKRLGTQEDGHIIEMGNSVWLKTNWQVNQTRFIPKKAFYCSLVFKDRLTWLRI